MARLGNEIGTESSAANALIVDSRDVFSRENFEQRLDMELAILTQQFQKHKDVNRQQARQVVEEFIKDVQRILRSLEDAKRKAETEEAYKISGIQQLLKEGTKITSRKFKEELEKFGETLKSNTVSGMRQYGRREIRLKRERAPIGYFLKKIRQDKSLEMDVAKRTGNITRDTVREHSLALEADSLITALNVKNLNEQGYAQLDGMIRQLVVDYERDLEDFLNIEIDIEITEARKLHRIDHYIAFLKMVGGFDDLIKKLNELKAAAQYWVYQDSIDAKKLLNYAKALNYGLNVLKASEAPTGGNFPGIVVQNSPIEGFVPGILIYNNNSSKPNRAVVLVHGVYQSKEALITLGKKLALLDFWVYSIDLTSHGESREAIQLGRSCEYIQTAVRWFRLNGISNVGVIGHSLGALATLFALCGYNSRVEKEFYNTVSEISIRLEQLEKYSRKRKADDKTPRWVTDEAVRLSEDYKKLKLLALDAMKQMYSGKARINAAVMLAAPISIQFVFPTAASRIAKNLPKGFHRVVGKGINALFNKWAKGQEGENTLLYKPMAQKGEVQIMSAVFSDVYHAYNYAQTAKNPCDFIEAINYLCDSRQGDRQVAFFKYYRDLIRRTPKLFIYGLADQWLKPLKKNNMPELEQHYKDMGATEKTIVRYPNVIHGLNKEGKDFQLEAGKLPELTYKAVTFLNGCLGRGRLPQSIKQAPLGSRAKQAVSAGRA